MACIYALIVSFFVYREMDLKKLYKILVDSCVSSAVVLFVVSMSAPFAWFMTSENIPTMISTAVMSLFNNKYIILLVMNLLLLFLGCFLETQSIILLVTPILLPMASYLGISEIALGLIIIVNTSIGMITPPMAVNLFVATGICKTTIARSRRKSFPICWLSLVSCSFIPTSRLSSESPLDKFGAHQPDANLDLPPKWVGVPFCSN